MVNIQPPICLGCQDIQIGLGRIIAKIVNIGELFLQQKNRS